MSSEQIESRALFAELDRAMKRYQQRFGHPSHALANRALTVPDDKTLRHLIERIEHALRTATPDKEWHAFRRNEIEMLKSGNYTYNRYYSPNASSCLYDFYECNLRNPTSLAKHRDHILKVLRSLTHYELAELPAYVRQLLTGKLH